MLWFSIKKNLSLACFELAQSKRNRFGFCCDNHLAETIDTQAKLDMARTVEIERNMTNSEAQYFATGDSLWRLIEYYTSVDIFSNVAGYLKNINIIFHHIFVQFVWYDKIDCIRVNCAIIY
jgi:hypothetical protein